MILIQLLIFILFSSLTLISLSGLGHIISFPYKKKFLDNIFFGLIVVAFMITSFHFFLRINHIIIAFIFFTGLFISLKIYRFSIIQELRRNNYYFLIFLILIPIYISQKYHEDFGYYHLPYLINLFNEKIIFGLANTNIAFVHNSIWLNIKSIFLFGENYNFTTIPSFLIYVVFIIFSIKKFNLKKNTSNYFLLISLIYFIIKFTRISEFGNDIPAILFSILAIFYFFKFIETNELSKKKYYFFCNFSFTVFSILIKFSCIPVLIITIFLFFQNYTVLKKQLFKLNYLFIYALCIIFFIQQFIYTGCLLFPSILTCFDVSWFNEDFIELKKNLELTNKSYSNASSLFSKDEYLRDFNWLSFWFERSYQEILEHLITMSLPVFLILIFLTKETTINKIQFKEKKIFVLFIFLSFIFWLNFSPVYRFSIVYFLSIIFIISLSIYNYKKITLNFFRNLIIIALIFNFTKNISRISSEDEIFFGVKKIKNYFIIYPQKNKDEILVYRPNLEKNLINGWQGRLCWDISFICSYNEIKIDKKYSYLFVNKLNN
jgi:hypothetical protein